jgi:hypothetical protein
MDQEAALTVSNFVIVFSSSSLASDTWTIVMSFIAGGPVGISIIANQSICRNSRDYQLLIQIHGNI